ncbi:hypothetical protein HA466_0051710 [Hirschfeldia incana]|nr:hypothetical protein HA466_0051710 [Hirschfeldia incana]
MAGEDDNNHREAHRGGDGHEESSPLLQGNNDTKTSSKEDAKTAQIAPPPPAAEEYGWTADGLPVSDGSVMGEPIGRNQWSSGLFSCLGRNDELCSSDLEVCVLGSVAPCVLYGTNAERLGSAVPGTFTNHCLTYSGLYFIGNSLFGWNCLAPWFSYSSRSAIRRRFNLEGSFEAMNRSCGCCGSCIEDEMQREHMETTCDFVTHLLCHTCALCQEGRELRRKVLHPGFNAAQSTVVVLPPSEQTMGRK